MHLNRNPSLLQAHVLRHGLLHTIHFIIFVLEDEGRWGLFGDVVPNVRLQLNAVLCNHQVAGIDRDREIWPAAHIVGRVYATVYALFK